jgi:hypothetical protein
LTTRRLRGRFGIAAPQVSVRTQVPWHLRILAAIVIIGVSAGAAWWAYDAGLRTAGFDQRESGQRLSELRDANQALEEEVGRLRNLLAASESSLQIERASQNILSEKNNTLVDENSKLKEELAVFERLTKVESKRDNEVALDQLNVRADAVPGLYRFSFLIALQGTRRGKEAKFSMQIVVTPRGESTSAKIAFPRGQEADPSQYEIMMRNFRRIEGKFDLPAGVVPSGVEVRIFEAGVLKASKYITL